MSKKKKKKRDQKFLFYIQTKCYEILGNGLRGVRQQIETVHNSFLLKGKKKLYKRIKMFTKSNEIRHYLQYAHIHIGFYMHKRL